MYRFSSSVTRIVARQEQRASFSSFLKQNRNNSLNSQKSSASYSSFLSHRHEEETSDTKKTSSESSKSFSTADSNTNNKHEGVFNKVACIGVGKMAQALIEPMVKTNLQPPSDFYIYDVFPETMQHVAEKYGVQTADSIPEVVQDADLILCAVKPQNLTSGFFTELRKGHAENAIFLSVIAGKPIHTFQEGGFEKIVRSMPNTPAQVGEGMTVWTCTDSLTGTDRKKIAKVLQSCGESLYVDSEDFVDMSTSISGSGPAYIFLLMESLIDGAVHMGFPRDKATTLVYHTMLGSTLYAMESGEHPAILRNMVTSPSGTTASALYELENGRMRTVIKDAMWACYRRSLEMGNHDSNVGPGRHSVNMAPLDTRDDDKKQ